MKKVSVIVPVYNVEAYLERCLNSLVNQTLQDIEIIVVDDGSTDGSSDIIQTFVNKYGNIRSFQKKNGGLSDARNYGVRQATGEYIGFVDSDDYVEENMYEILYYKAKSEQSQIVECNLRHTYDNFEDIEIGKKITDKKEMLMFGRSVVWNKIYRRSWLLETNVIFSKGLIYEDVEYFLKLIPYITSYSYVDPALVHYVQRSSSINNMSCSKTLDIIRILTNISTFYKEHGFYEEYESSIEFFYIRILLCSSFTRMCRIPKAIDRKMALEENWNFLITTFPHWKDNQVLGTLSSKKGRFMRTVNPTTYRIYGFLFSKYYRLRAIFA